MFPPIMCIIIFSKWYTRVAMVGAWKPTHIVIYENKKFKDINNRTKQKIKLQIITINFIKWFISIEYTTNIHNKYELQN